MALQSQQTTNVTQQATVGEFNRQMFFFEQMLAKVQTSLPVRVVAVTNSGGVSPTGFVDVVPMVTQTDATGVAVPHTTIFNLPYCRVQGGANAVIIDPQVGDKGVAVFASRDISKVKYTGNENPPGSDRRYSFSDGMFVSTMFTQQPTRYVRISDEGIEIIAPDAITITAPAITINGPVTLNGSLTATGDVTAQGTSLHTHVHSGVAPGSSNTGGPV